MAIMFSNGLNYAEISNFDEWSPNSIILNTDAQRVFALWAFIVLHYKKAACHPSKTIQNNNNQCYTCNMRIKWRCTSTILHFYIKISRHRSYTYHVHKNTWTCGIRFSKSDSIRIIISDGKLPLFKDFCFTDLPSSESISPDILTSFWCKRRYTDLVSSPNYIGISVA